MAEKPQEYTVAQVTGKSDAPWGDNNDMLTTKVRFEGGEKEWKIFHNVAWGFEAHQGDVLEGWLDHAKGKFGLSNRHKEGGGGGAAPTSSSTGTGGGAPSQGGSRDESIERQVAVKAVAVVLAGPGGAEYAKPSTFAQDVRFMVDAFHDAIKAADGVPQGVPVEGQPRQEIPADTAELQGDGAAKSDDDIPF